MYVKLNNSRLEDLLRHKILILKFIFMIFGAEKSDRNSVVDHLNI